jgi:phosphatidylethanolamine/phosphatidyl-N-methylethanolamine N-methyltransferase
MTDTKSSGYFRDELRFLRRLLARPVQIGAIAPSSAALARAMAREVDPDRLGPILELGPGTGVVTAALISRGVAPERIVSVEFDAELGRLMTERFPRVHVVCGDAFDLAQTLGAEWERPFAAIVSSLPLRNQPMARRQALVEGVLRRLMPGGPFVQFSYGLTPPVPAGAGFRVTQTAFVLANLPPARVWVYRQV